MRADRQTCRHRQIGMEVDRQINREINRLNEKRRKRNTEIEGDKEREWVKDGVVHVFTLQL